jgi:hypothetical protein
MLRPTKHSDPNETVLPVAALLLARLRRLRIESFTTLRDLVRKKKEGLEPLFVPALNLLFLLGLIEYRVKTDSFEYIGP